MNTFSVKYIGQLRYYECIKNHRVIVEGAKNISCTLIPFIKETWKGTFKAKHSIKEKSLDDIALDIGRISWINDFKLLEENPEEYLDYKNTTIIHLFPCEYFITLAKSLSDIDCDFDVFITTDLIFSSNTQLVAETLSRYTVDEIPTIYCNQVDNNKSLMSTQVMCINRAARNCIIKNWKSAVETFLLEDHEFKYRNEYVTMRLLNLCGIETVNELRMWADVIRFRDNMDIQNLTNVRNIKLLSAEYSNSKREFINDRNKRK